MAKMNACEWCNEEFETIVDNHDTCACICGTCYDLMVECAWEALEKRYAMKGTKPATTEKAPLDILASPSLPDDKKYWEDASKMLSFDFGVDEKKKEK